MVDRRIAEGRAGVTFGKGYFDRANRSPKQLSRECHRKLLASQHALRNIRPMEAT